MSAARQALGDWGEARAEAYLRGQGMRILGRKVRTRLGEIDLVALDRDTLVFVEVKARAQASPGTDPLENVHRAKQARLGRAAAAYLMDVPGSPACRFDVVALIRRPERIEHHPGAFTL